MWREKNGLYGYIDVSGKLIIPYQYSYVNPFTDSIACVKDPSLDKYGFIDHTGKIVFPFEYEDATSFCGGMAKVTKNGEKGFIDRKGNFHLYRGFDEVSSFKYLNDFK